MMMWLTNLKNALFAGVAAVLGGLVLWFRWSAGKFERQAEKARQKAEQEARRAESAESAMETQAKAAKAVKLVREKARAQPKPDVKKRADLDNDSW